MAIILSENLKKFFIAAFDEAVKQTIADGKLDYHAEHYRQPDILSIVEHLEAVLDRKKLDLDGDDRLVLNCFLPSLRQTIRHRKLTMGATSLVSTLTDFIRYICLWLNSEKGYNVDIKLISRRKALTSELKKILLKSLEHAGDPDLMLTPPVIRDRFGLRIILADDNPDLLLEVVRIIVAILTNPDSDSYLEFTCWLKSANCKFGGESIPKEMLLDFLKYHFTLGNVKNYVLVPKSSTYQSWQGTLTVDATSPNLGGFMFELQARTAAMHKNAEYGPASHDKYKEEIELIVKDIFEIKEYSGGIVFYEGPDYPDLDLDGLGICALILLRHISPHVVERTSH